MAAITAIWLYNLQRPKIYIGCPGAHLFITAGNRGIFWSVLTTVEIWYSEDEGVRKRIILYFCGGKEAEGVFSWIPS